MKSLHLTLALVVLTACGPKSQKSVTNIISPIGETNSQSAVKNPNVELLNQLLKSRASNLALAELLIKTFPHKEQEEIKSILDGLNQDDAQAIIRLVIDDNKAIRNNYLYQGHELAANKEFLDNALTSSSGFENTSMTIEDQLKISTFGLIKNKALNEIITTYDNRANQLMKELAKALAFEIAHSQDASNITLGLKNNSKERVLRLIQSSAPFVSKVDKYFRGSGLNENEQYAVIVSGALAGAIYLEIKDDPEFKRIMAESSQIIQDAQVLHGKIKEMGVLLTALNKHYSETSKNLQDLQKGLSGASQEMTDAFKVAFKKVQDPTLSPDDPQKIEAKRIMDFLYKKVLLNSKTDETNISILSKPVRISENISRSVNAAGNISDNLSNIISTTNSMMNVLGMKPSKDLQKALATAQKVSMVMNMAKSAITGFASGGALGAFAALGSGPMMSMLGGGDQGTAQIMGQLKVMDKKLNEILKNQAEMMRVQVETMKMIKDLALMVDQYHHEEMVSLAGLRSLQLVNIELQKSILNKDIRACENIIDYQLSSIWSDYNTKNPNRSAYGITDINLVKSSFMKNISGLKDIRRIITATSETAFQDCQKGIADAFGNSHLEENPIRSIFSSSEQTDLNDFQNEIYKPLLSSLETLSEKDNFTGMGLNLPAKNLTGLSLKIPSLNNPDETVADSLEMDNLISTKSLERYLSQLLVLYPILEVDKEVWFKDHQEIINTYVVYANTESNQNIRSHYFLTNALHLIQSAIAQEALLAGEPLLHQLEEKLKNELLNNQITCEAAGNVVCNMRKNNLLMSNYLVFTLAKQKVNDSHFMISYSRALGTSDIPAMMKIFNTTDSSIFVIEENQMFLKLKVGRNEFKTIKMPTIDELEKEELRYSENMPRLLMMRDAVLESLEKVTPSQDDRTQLEKENFLKLLTLSVKF